MEVDRRSFSRGRSERQRSESSVPRGADSRNSKRSYQRENTTRSQNSQEACNGDDLRSPCHKQPRFKGHKENRPENKTHVNHRWSKMRASESEVPWSKKSPLSLCTKQWPPLGFFDIDNYTPEANKDWGTLVEEEELGKPHNEGRKQPLKFKRKLLLSESKESDNNKEKAKPSSNSKQPSASPKPIVTDPHKLDQRQKQLDIGKNTVAYGRYIAEMPRQKRQKEDPWTPDKFQQCSTRSWVGQIKVWRRRLHTWDPPSSSQEDLFTSSSTSSSQVSDPDGRMEVEIPKAPSRPVTPDDFFSGFDLDACLIDDGFPL